MSGIPHSQRDPLDTGASLTLIGKSFCKNKRFKKTGVKFIMNIYKVDQETSNSTR